MGAEPSTWTSAWHRSQSPEHGIVARLAGRDGTLLEGGEGGSGWGTAAHTPGAESWLLSCLSPRWLMVFLSFRANKALPFSSRRKQNHQYVQAPIILRVAFLAEWHGQLEHEKGQ